MEKLFGLDYMTMPMPTLMKHPDFSMKVFKLVAALSELDSNQIENLVDQITSMINDRSNDNG